ncbi:putative integral membrane protein [Neofusicoccum parvum]|nr:putative integral membrane protein [Neofusicoccum parvum]
MASSDNRGPELLYVCAVMVGMAFISTVLRVYVRLGVVKAFGIDDWFMVAATLTHIMFATCAIGGIHYGTGRHMNTLEPENAMKAMRYWWLCYVAYCLTMISAKISIGYFLLRLTVHRIHVWIIWTVMGLTVLTGAVFFFVTLFQCNPISYFWTQTIGEKGTCIPVEVIMALTYLYGTISAICDFTFGILPIFLVWNLNMRKSLKIALIPILSMACIASSAVLVRMAYIKDFKNPDFLYATVDIAIWSDTEQGLAITAGSLATLRPLFRMVTASFNSYGTGRNTPSHNLTPGGISNKQQKTVWPSDNQSRGRSGSRGGPWSLLRTETDGDFEMVTKVTKAGGSPSPPGTAIGGRGAAGGIVKGTEVLQVTEERVPGGEQAEGKEKRKSWWRVVERERSRDSAEDTESQKELNAVPEYLPRKRGGPGDFV